MGSRPLSCSPPKGSNSTAPSSSPTPSNHSSPFSSPTVHPNFPSQAPFSRRALNCTITAFSALLSHLCFFLTAFLQLPFSNALPLMSLNGFKATAGLMPPSADGSRGRLFSTPVSLRAQSGISSQCSKPCALSEASQLSVPSTHKLINSRCASACCQLHLPPFLPPSSPSLPLPLSCPLSATAKRPSAVKTSARTSASLWSGPTGWPSTPPPPRSSARTAPAGRWSSTQAAPFASLRPPAPLWRLVRSALPEEARDERELTAEK